MFAQSYLTADAMISATGIALACISHAPKVCRTDIEWGWPDGLACEFPVMGDFVGQHSHVVAEHRHVDAFHRVIGQVQISDIL